MKSKNGYNKGKNNPMYGKHHSEETKRKIGKVHRGSYHSEETRRKISEANKEWYRNNKHPWQGRHHSEETKKKISESHIGKRHSEKTRKKMSEKIRQAMTLEIRKKLSETHMGHESYWKGKRLSENHKRRIGEGVSGEKNGRWQGGLSFEPYGIEFSESLKEQIRERDSHQCQICGAKRPQMGNINDIDYEKIDSFQTLDVHHIDYNKQNNSPENLVSLCHSCHSKTNTNRNKWKKFLTEKIRREKT